MENGFQDFNPFEEEENKEIKEEEYINPFIEEKVLEDEKEEKKKKGFHLFKKKEEEEEEVVTTLTLDQVKNMTFTEDEDLPQVIEKPSDNEPIDLDSIHEEKRIKIKTGLKKFKRLIKVGVFLILCIGGYFFYSNYSKNVNQILSYKFGSDVFELSRVKDKLSVSHKIETCVDENCSREEINQYDIQFDSIPSCIIRIYFDITFRLGNGEKTITANDIGTTLSSHSVYSMIHNDPRFLGFKKYKKYTILESLQKSEYQSRGYLYEEAQGHFYLSIALGKKDSNGYDIRIMQVYENEGDLVFYIKETIPTKKDQWIRETTPAMSIELNDKPRSVRVINISNGEEFNPI